MCDQASVVVYMPNVYFVRMRLFQFVNIIDPFALTGKQSRIVFPCYMIN